MSIPLCPTCGQPPSGTCESLTGVARLMVDDGALAYAGETEIDWNDQTTNTNDAGQIEFWCKPCLCSWFASYGGQIF